MKLGATFTPKSELHEEICNPLSTYLKLPESEIILTSNEDKYHEKDDPALMTQPLEEIFGLMRGLNEIGLQDDTIEATKDSEKGFVYALRHALTDIYNLNGEDPLQYTELGPELFVTNYCVKYTLEDYKKVRESTGKFRVLSQHTTGHGAIVFQVT